MKQVTIRSIPDEVKKTVQKEAERKGVSLNKGIISLLERARGTKTPEKKKRVHTVYSPIFGYCEERRRRSNLISH